MIEDTFTRDGFTMSLLNKGDNAVVYALQKHGGHISYEVMRTRKRPKDVFIGARKICEAGEDYLPSNNEWGTYGFSYKDYDSAINKFNELKDKPVGRI